MNIIIILSCVKAIEIIQRVPESDASGLEFSETTSSLSWLSDTDSGSPMSSSDDDSEPGVIEPIAASDTEGLQLAIVNTAKGATLASSERPVKITRFEFLQSEIVHMVTCLYQLSSTIQEPAAKDRLHKYKDIKITHFSQFEHLHAQDKFPGAPEFLIQRLATANLRRRQMLVYRKMNKGNTDHKEEEDARSQPIHGKLDKLELDASIEPLLVTQDALMNVHDQRSTTTATVTTGLNSYTTLETFIEKTCNPVHGIDHDFQSEAGRSQTSYAPSSAAGNVSKIFIPPAPKALDGTPFHCPYCFFIIMPKDDKDWM